ncbi:MAG: hypothetical protein JWR26_3227 [Pedosphaera sp.]|nr:hypothetical protein [Pedosphaera sp.]
MTSKAQRFESVVRIICAIAISFAAALFLLIFAAIYVEGIRRRNFGDNVVLPIVLGIVALLSFFSVHIAWKLWRGSLSSNGITIIPAWTIWTFGVFFLAVILFDARYSPSRRLVLEVVSMALIMVFFGRRLSRKIGLAILTPDEHYPEVSIIFTGISNSANGPLAQLRLKNECKYTVRLNPDCTLYWENRFGIAANELRRHDLGQAMLRPGQSNSVSIPLPAETRVWNLSIKYDVEPSGFEKLRLWVPGHAVFGDKSFERQSPLVTNSTVTGGAEVPPLR